MKSNKAGQFTKGMNPVNDKVAISSEYFQNDRPSYICSICNRTLSRLSDAGNNNSIYWCRNCSVEFDPQLENLRKESKIIVPDRNQEPSITSIGVTPDVSIRHETRLKDGALALSKEGTIRFTSYQDSSQR